MSAGVTRIWNGSDWVRVPSQGPRGPQGIQGPEALFWSGSQDEYDALTPDENTLYLIGKPTFADIVLADDPVAYYRLNEISGNFADSSSYQGPSGVPMSTPAGQYAVIPGQPSLLPNGEGQSVYFERGTATNTAYIEAAFSSPLALGDAPFSIEAWMRLDTAVAYNDGVAIVSTGSPGFGFGFGISVSNFQPAFFVQGGAGSNSGFGTGTMPGGPGTYHAVVTRAASVVVYVNGVAFTGTIPGGGGQNNSSPLGIGRRPAGSIVNWMSSPSALQEVAIYNYALTSTQVQAHYAAGGGT